MGKADGFSVGKSNSAPAPTTGSIDSSTRLQPIFKRVHAIQGSVCEIVRRRTVKWRHAAKAGALSTIQDEIQGPACAYEPRKPHGSGLLQTEECQRIQWANGSSNSIRPPPARGIASELEAHGNRHRCETLLGPPALQHTTFAETYWHARIFPRSGNSEIVRRTAHSRIRRFCEMAR